MKKTKIGSLLLTTLILASCSNSGGGDTPVDYSKAIIDAKNNTLAASSYVYDYKLNSSVKFVGAISVSPVSIVGKVQHSNVAQDGTNHLEKREFSGALVFDSTTYKYNVDDAYISVSSNEKKDFSVADSTTIPQGYDFESNSVGKIFKSLENNGNITTTKVGDKYKVSLKTNFASSSILSIANFMDSGKIVKVLNKYLSKWQSSVNPECYITLSSDNKTVTNFTFNVDINIKDIVDVKINYSQDFSKLNEKINFEKPQFENTVTKTEEIAAKLDEIKTLFDSSKNNYYKYVLKTGVDHGVAASNPLGLAVNSTSKGYAERKVVGNNIYFHNELELDSDYKNKDQYPEFVEDYKLTRANVTNDEFEVYDVKKNILKDEYFGLKDYKNHDVDDYFMLVDKAWFSTDAIKILRKTTKDEVTTYKFGLTQNYVKEILKHYNKSIRLDKDAVKWIDVFEGFNNFNVKKSDYVITVKNSKIDNISLVLKGFYDMSETDDVKFSLDLDINFDYTQKEYSIPEKKEDIKR